jgi:hypothetical protein
MSTMPPWSKFAIPAAYRMSARKEAATRLKLSLIRYGHFIRDDFAQPPAPSLPCRGNWKRVMALQIECGSKATMSAIVLESVLTCPRCGFARQETMPTDACQFYYECSNCKALLRPNPGDCCVFCSFGSVKCPPIQQQRGCCG